MCQTKFQMLDFPVVAQELGIVSPEYETVAMNWEKSLVQAPTTIPDFLLPVHYKQSRATCSLEDSVDQVLDAAAAKIVASPALTSLIWHCYHETYFGGQCHFDAWPNLHHAMGEDLAGVFYLLVGLGHVPLTLARHQVMGIAQSISRDTCLQVQCFCMNYQIGNGGRIGLRKKQLRWLGQYPQGRLFRLGRMEYKILPFANEYETYRHRHTGEKLMLALDGGRYDAQGFVDGLNGKFDEVKGWTSSIQRTDSTVRGYPVSPWGCVEQKPVTLNLAHWELVLKKGDWIIDTHIPSGGGLSPKVCLDSFRRAINFFATYFPNEKAIAINCRSWIFNPLFDTALPDSNLAKLGREVYLYPIPSGDDSGISFVFCKKLDELDLATAPRETSMQRLMLQRVEEGKPLRSSGMLLFVEDLPHFGKQFYRECWSNGIHQNDSVHQTL